MTTPETMPDQLCLGGHRLEGQTTYGFSVKLWASINEDNDGNSFKLLRGFSKVTPINLFYD